jgi:hypothetical protein
MKETASWGKTYHKKTNRSRRKMQKLQAQAVGLPILCVLDIYHVLERL